MDFRDVDESILEMAYVMIESGLVEKKAAFKGVPERFREFLDVEKLARDTQT